MVAPAKLQTVDLREAHGQSGVSHDAQAHVLTGVKILGLESKNRRRYTPESVRAALALYEGAKVYIDHPADPKGARSLTECFGRLKGVRIDGRDVKGDLAYNPHHAMAPSVKWWAENDPGALGMSHNAIGQGRTKDGVFVVEKIVSVRSVDLVADPATTKSLYEWNMEPDALGAPPVDDALPNEADEGYEAKLGHLVHAIMTDDSLDVGAKRKKILAALKLLDDEGGKPAEEPKEEAADEAVKAARASTDPHVKAILERLDKLETEKAFAGRRVKARQLCERLKLAPVLVTEVFLDQLTEARDDAAMRALIEDRRAIAGHRAPRSAGPSAGHGPTLDAKSFASRVRGQ